MRQDASQPRCLCPACFQRGHRFLFAISCLPQLCCSFTEPHQCRRDPGSPRRGDGPVPSAYEGPRARLSLGRGALPQPRHPGLLPRGAGEAGSVLVKSFLSPPPLPPRLSEEARSQAPQQWDAAGGTSPGKLPLVQTHPACPIAALPPPKELSRLNHSED